jgi:hypothetical protein
LVSDTTHEIEFYSKEKLKMANKNSVNTTSSITKHTRKQLEKSTGAGAVDKSDFNKLVYSSLNSKDDGISKPDENKPLRIEKNFNKHIVDLAVSQTKGWRFSAPSHQISLEGKEINIAESGLSIMYCELNADEDLWQAAKFYLGSQTGKVGINTYNPNAQLHVVQSEQDNDLLKLTLANNADVVHVDKNGATTLNKTLTLNEELIINKALQLPGGVVTSITSDKLDGNQAALVTDKVVRDYITNEINRLQNLLDQKAPKEGDRGQNFASNDLVATTLSLAEGEKITAIATAVDLGGADNSDSRIPTQKAVKEYVDNRSNDAANNLSTHANHTTAEFSRLQAELSSEIVGKANKQGDGGEDFQCNHLLANSLKLTASDVIRAISNANDLGGEQSSHINLATQKAVKEYNDNAVKNAIFADRSGLKVYIGEAYFEGKNYRDNHPYLEVVTMPHAFSKPSSYFINADVVESNEHRQPAPNNAVFTTHDWWPITQNTFAIRLRFNNFGGGRVKMILIRYFAIGY